MTYKKIVAVIAVIVAAVFVAELWRATTDDASTPQSPTTSNAATPAPTTPPATDAAEEGTTGEPPTPAEEADVVAARSMTVAHTWAPATDGGPSAGFRRAEQWFTPELDARLNADAGTTKGPGAQWEQWKRENAQIYAQAQPGCSGCPPDTDTTAHRVVAVTQTAVTATRSTTVDPPVTVWLTLTKRAGTWLVDDLHY